MGYMGAVPCGARMQQKPQPVAEKSDLDLTAGSGRIEKRAAFRWVIRTRLARSDGSPATYSQGVW